MSQHQNLCCEKLNMTCLLDLLAFVATKFPCVTTEFLHYATLYVVTINFYVATFFSVFSLIYLFICHDRVLNVVTVFQPFTLFSIAIFISMSQHNPGASSGALLMKCRDRVIKCHDNTSAFRLPLWCDIHFFVATFSCTPHIMLRQSFDYHLALCVVFVAIWFYLLR